MDVREYYSEGYELGLRYDFGPQMPPPPPLGVDDPIEQEALSLWFNGFNCGVQQQLARRAGVSVSRGKVEKINDQLKEIVYSLARLVRGTDCIYPTNKGIMMGQLLVKLRMLDGTEYDKRVIQKKD